jgi:hypothetical protein
MLASVAAIAIGLAPGPKAMQGQTPAWQAGTSSMVLTPASANLAIGTTAAGAKVDVRTSHGDGIALVQADAPWNWIKLALDASGHNVLNSAYAVVIRPDEHNIWTYTNVGVGIDIKATSSSIATRNAFRIRTDYTGSPTTLFTVLGNGNVGIGTTAPQYKLAVNGTIGTKEVTVTSSGWADYVFKPEYKLKPLSEVRAHIKKHGRLPEIPSETEVREKGVSLGEMQVKLLAKIEELTLHMIQAEERNNRLERQNQELQARMARLESDLVENRLR